MTQSKFRKKTFLPNLILSIVFVLGSVQISPAIELLSYWDFNDPGNGTSATDVTGNSPDLELNGGATFTEDAGGLS
ncbi:MAG: hypothetical protein MK172_05430, partial [Verrucomicrobiales bacterium]|nr:hypothetical protein [Verrucomicrobiales bacterium]